MIYDKKFNRRFISIIIAIFLTATFSAVAAQTNDKDLLIPMGNAIGIQAETKAQTEFQPGTRIRDRMVGVGTVTYLNPSTNQFGALGHGIHDTESSRLLLLESGKISPADVINVKRGIPGEPGELRGSFDLNENIGELYKNTENGIFGTTDAMPSAHQPLPVAEPNQVRTGDAIIYSQVNGGEVCEYDVEILRLLNNRDSRNMIIKVTDEDLIAATGGIVQGMSGSPIVQDGKIIGAVTHVFVNDAQKGYGIFITNMLKAETAECGVELSVA